MKKIKFFTILFLIISLCSCVSNKSPSETITNQNKIDEKIFVPINSANQYLLIRGNNIKNPVILYLHGGPGIPYSGILYELIEGLKDDFTFVTWDQRGMGQTYYENEKNNPEDNLITREKSLEDVDYVVDYLRSRFNKDKIIIIGHSYGSFLGISYLNTHPEKINHYIGIAQNVNYREALHCDYKEAWDQLKDSPKKQEKLDEEYKYIEHTNDSKRAIHFQTSINKFLEKNMPGLIKEDKIKLMNSPDFTHNDFKWFAGLSNIERHISRTDDLMQWLGNTDLFKENKTFSIPIDFISGEYDKICPVELVQQYFEEIKAPSKSLNIIPLTGHSPQLTRPGEVVKVIKNCLQNQSR